MQDKALNNAEIADRLMSLAQLLSTQRENSFKVKAYRRAAKTIRNLSESIDELVRAEADLTQYSGIGKGISGAIREIVLSGALGQLEALRSQSSPELASLSEYPRLDPNRVLRIYKKLNISSVAALQEKLGAGEIARTFGQRMEEHVLQGLGERQEMLLYEAEPVAAAMTKFLLDKCGARRVELTGDFRRRVEVLGAISFLIDTADFQAVCSRVVHYGGQAVLLSSTDYSAVLRLSSGVIIRIDTASESKWGLAWIVSTGSEEHLQKLNALGHDLTSLATSRDRYAGEAAVYRRLGLTLIPPELREGHDEVAIAAQGGTRSLVSAADIRGDLHAHSTSSDGTHTVEEMAEGARKKGYEYVGITDHSQSLKIAGGVSEENLWKQIRLIDSLNEKISGIRILKSAEVDILADGSLDYPDALLKELDYTVCSIHSRFGLGKTEQTERILRAMDNRYFTILGHATGRRLLKRPGYELDMHRLIQHAAKNRCFFEINSSPERLDLSAANARLASAEGIKIAVCTDAHSIREFDLIRCGLDQARRAGLVKASVLNCFTWPELRKIIQR